jgi:hypothetical protein
MVIIIIKYWFKNNIQTEIWIDVLLDHLCRINHGESIVGIIDQLFDFQLFNVKVKWYSQIINYSCFGKKYQKKK